MTLEEFRNADRRLQEIESRLTTITMIRQRPINDPFLQTDPYCHLRLTEADVNHILNMVANSLMAERELLQKELSKHLV